MDFESERTRKLGCWDGVAACTGPINNWTSTKPIPDFEPEDSFCNFLIDIGFGKDCDSSVRDFWLKTIKSNYRGDAGRKRARMAAINLRERDGLHGRLSDVVCPVMWLHVSSGVSFVARIVDRVRAKARRNVWSLRSFLGHERRGILDRERARGDQAVHQLATRGFGHRQRWPALPQCIAPEGGGQCPGRVCVEVAQALTICTTCGHMEVSSTAAADLSGTPSCKALRGPVTNTTNTTGLGTCQSTSICLELYTRSGRTSSAGASRTATCTACNWV